MKNVAVEEVVWRDKELKGMYRNDSAQMGGHRN